MKVEKSGYGAGSRDFADHPNVLRLTIGGAGEAATSLADTITVLEANLDDLSPQVLAYATERLLAEGALDVFSTPVQMKKNRSGALLTVLTNGTISNYAPEYEDCRQLAEAHHVPLKMVMESATQQYLQGERKA
jgi:hypothetical protein